MDATAHTNRPLGQIATVQAGYPSRDGIRSAADGTHRLLQAKDVSGDSGVLLDHATRFHPKRKPELYEVHRGDILVVARGQSHRAYQVDQESTSVVAAATFYIVRPDVHHVRAGYLAWWLNLPCVQAVLDASSRGTNIAYIGRDAIEALDVPVPPLSLQEGIERVVVSWRRRKSVQSQIDAKREQYIQEVCWQAVRRSKER